MSVQHLTPAMFSLLSDGVLRAAPPELKNTGKADRREKKARSVSIHLLCHFKERFSLKHCSSEYWWHLWHLFLQSDLAVLVTTYCAKNSVPHASFDATFHAYSCMQAVSTCSLPCTIRVRIASKCKCRQESSHASNVISPTSAAKIIFESKAACKRVCALPIHWMDNGQPKHIYSILILKEHTMFSGHTQNSCLLRGVSSLWTLLKICCTNIQALDSITSWGKHTSA